MGKNYIGIDLGASSGRVSVGQYDGSKINIEEIYRFENRPVFLHETFYWDFLRLFSEVKEGIVKSMHKYQNRINKMGIDTWGIDFGLLDGDGRLLSNPVTYRDKRTQGMLEEVSKIVSIEDIFMNTGEFVMEINTLFQLYSMVRNDSPLLHKADKLLMIPDLFNYFLTGNQYGEFTDVITTSLFDQNTAKWSDYLIQKLNIPSNIFPGIIRPGMSAGKVTSQIEEELNIKDLEVIATGSHDASSSIAGMPVSREVGTREFGYIIIGTWSGLGIELRDKPLITPRAFKLGFSNEGGVENRFSFQKILSGLWLLQECQAYWSKKENREIPWKEIDEAANRAPAFKNFIDMDNPEFTIKRANVIESISTYFNSMGQKTNLDIGSISRCIYEALVFKYKKAIQDIESITGKKIEVVLVGGGGANNKYLCQWISDALEIPVMAGITETTTVGNIMIQLKADGEISGMDEARYIVADSFDAFSYMPGKGLDWNSSFKKYLEVTGI